MWTGSILLQWLSSPTLHCILIFCITLQPFHTFYHFGFHKARSVKFQLHLIFNLFNVSLSPAEAQRTFQEALIYPFLQGSFSLILWIFIPWPWWNRVDGNEMGKFWHHWLSCCSCSLLLVWADWSEVPSDWQVFLLWGVLVIIQDMHKLGIPKAIDSFFQGKCSGTHSSPPAVVSTASLFPSLWKHHIEKKLSSPQSAAY